MHRSISVVIPAFNAVATIGDTLESLQRQTCGSLEIIVVDDGSTDGTADFVRTRFPLVRVVVQANQGVAAARNSGIAAARGDFIGFVDADDRWLPRAAERLHDALVRAPPSVGLAYAWSVHIDEHGRPIGRGLPSLVAGDVWTTLLAVNFLGHASATMLRRSTLERVGLYDTSFRASNSSGCEDWDLYLRIAERFQYAVVPEWHVEYRKTSESMTAANPDAMARSHALLLRRIADRGLFVPPLARRLSLALFQKYLAAECQRHRRFRQSRTWLSRAAWHGMPWICVLPGFYASVGHALLTSDGPARPLATVVDAGRRGTTRVIDGILLRSLHGILTRLHGQMPRRTAIGRTRELQGETVPQPPRSGPRPRLQSPENR